MAIYGVSFKKSVGQQKLVELIMNKQKKIIFGVGKAGTGKNTAALACALHLKENKEVEDIIYTINPVQTGENIGYLPGGIEEKVDPFMAPLDDALLGISRLSTKFGEKHTKAERKSFVEQLKSQIIIEPVFNMRGRTFENTIMIVDECQNLDFKTLNTLMTRMGNFSKIVLLGSYNQIDNEKLRKKEKCDFQLTVEEFSKKKKRKIDISDEVELETDREDYVLDYVGFVELTDSLRNPICVEIDDIFTKLKKMSK